MSGTEEATVNLDGSTTFETPPVNDTMGGGDDQQQQQQDFGGSSEGGTGGEEFAGGDAGEAAVEKGIDPALYLLLGFALVVAVYLYLLYRRRKTSEVNDDDFFSNLDVEKFNLKLPAEVQEYYNVKDKCEDSGWEPGQVPKGDPSSVPLNAPHRVMAQALMKRAIADIPIVQHIQKESPGMNKLYSQSMCSVKQWRAYQSAEALVSAEVDDVRAEADEIEPGWSNVIWRQAMQYHEMLKQKHEHEAKQLEEATKKKKQMDGKVSAEKKKVDDAKAKELAAEKAAQELLKMEEREKQSRKAFKGGGMKKGFLDSNNSKGKKK